MNESTVGKYDIPYMIISDLNISSSSCLKTDMGRFLLQHELCGIRIFDSEDIRLVDSRMTGEI